MERAVVDADANTDTVTPAPVSPQSPAPAPVDERVRWVVVTGFVVLPGAAAFDVPDRPYVVLWLVGSPSSCAGAARPASVAWSGTGCRSW